MIEGERFAYGALECVHAEQDRKAKHDRRKVKARSRPDETDEEGCEHHGLEDVHPPIPGEIVAAGQLVHELDGTPHQGPHIGPLCELTGEQVAPGSRGLQQLAETVRVLDGQPEEEVSDGKGHNEAAAIGQPRDGGRGACRSILGWKVGGGRHPSGEMLLGFPRRLKRF